MPIWHNVQGPPPPQQPPPETPPGPITRPVPLAVSPQMLQVAQPPAPPDIHPPLRPDYGRSGRPILLRANHFQVSLSLYLMLACGRIVFPTKGHHNSVFIMQVKSVVWVKRLAGRNPSFKRGSNVDSPCPWKPTFFGCFLRGMKLIKPMEPHQMAHSLSIFSHCPPKTHHRK